MEYGRENNIFILKMMMKSGLEKIMRKLFSNKWIYYIEKHRVTSSVIKMAFFVHGGISIILFVVYLHVK